MGLTVFNQIKNLISFESKTSKSFTIDMHAHLLPNIDDGVKDYDEAINIIESMQKMGFKKVIITPHIKTGHFNNTKQSIEEEFEKLQEQVNELNINIKLDFAAEYYYDEYFLEKIEQNDLLLINDEYLLFELSYHTPPHHLEETLMKIKKMGIRPVLAHPERYPYLFKKLHKINDLKALGLLIQINANSLSGFYGKKPQRMAKQLINQGMVDFIASDMHSMRYLNSFKKSLKSRYLKRLERKKSLLNHSL